MAGSRFHPYSQNMLGRSPSIVVPIDSRDRDRNAWPSASNFRIALPRVFRNVYAVRLLMVIIPFDPSWAGDQYIVLRCPELETMEGVASDENVRTSSLCEQGFAVLYPGPALPVTGQPSFYPRTIVDTQQKFHKQFVPPQTLSTLKFELWRRGNCSEPQRATLPAEPPGVCMRPENNIQLVFEIISQ